MKKSRYLAMPAFLITTAIIILSLRSSPEERALANLQACASVSNDRQFALLEECVRRTLPAFVRSSFEPLLLDWLLDARTAKLENRAVLQARMETIAASRTRTLEGTQNLALGGFLALLFAGTRLEVRPARARKTAPKRRALVIDDDAGFRESLAEILAAEGYKVDQARDLKEAVRLVRHGNYDCVFCDYHLEDTLGTDLCDQLFDEAEKMKCVIVSGSAPEEVLPHTSGFSGFIQKPCSATDILRHAERLAG